MQAFKLPQLISKQAAGDRLYLEFLKVPDLFTQHPALMADSAYWSIPR